MNQVKYPSLERVERDGYLVYALGDEIPLTDTDELLRQGHLTDADLADLIRLGVLVPAQTDSEATDRPVVNKGRTRPAAK
jgi:hypothetical protein